mgnify:FL=1
MKKTGKRCQRLVDEGRRSFLRGSAASVGTIAAATILQTKKVEASNFPSNKLANVKDLKTNVPLDINYPDEDSPGVLLKLGSKVEGGVGPDGDIVAYSVLCPHKGYPLNYNDADKVFNCPGHYSVFDAEKGGLQVWGQATQNLPQFKLKISSGGDIFAEGVDELIYGRLSNVL